MCLTRCRNKGSQLRSLSRRMCEKATPCLPQAQHPRLLDFASLSHMFIGPFQCQIHLGLAAIVLSVVVKTSEYQ